MSDGGTTRYKLVLRCISDSIVKSDALVFPATIGSRYRERNDRAVDSTPEASLEALFKNDWAACDAVFQATSSTSVQ